MKSNYLAVPDMLFQLLLDLAQHKLCLPLHTQWVSLIPSFFQAHWRNMETKLGANSSLFNVSVLETSPQTWFFPLSQGCPALTSWTGKVRSYRNSVTNSIVSPVKYSTEEHSLRRSAKKWSNKRSPGCVHSLPCHLSIPLPMQALACTIWAITADTT